MQFMNNFLQMFSFLWKWRQNSSNLERNSENRWVMIFGRFAIFLIDCYKNKFLCLDHSLQGRSPHILLHSHLHHLIRLYFSLLSLANFFTISPCFVLAPPCLYLYSSLPPRPPLLCSCFSPLSLWVPPSCLLSPLSDLLSLGHFLCNLSLPFFPYRLFNSPYSFTSFTHSLGSSETSWLFI